MKIGRTWYAAGLLAAALAVLLIGWFVSGWADVRARQNTEEVTPVREAAARGAQLAHELRAELGQLMTREVERPYFHYQNLFHDPRATGTVGVTPSPLSTGPADALVLGYFQLDAAGRATTPTINDDVPELSEPRRLADNQRFRAEVRSSLGRELAPPERAPGGDGAAADTAEVTTVAEVSRPVAPRTQPREVPPVQPQVPKQEAQQVQIDPNSYVQNWNSNTIYQQYRNDPGLESAEAPPRVPDVATPEVKPVGKPVGTPVARPTIRPATPTRVATTTKPITITVDPLEWRTLSFGGVSTLVAVRRVDTPDGALAQGFVVDRTALTSWLAGRAGDAVAELRTGDDAATEIAPGWHLEVSANPRALARAAESAAAVATRFLLRFIVLGVIAALAAGLVVLLVSRAERLARERSQFAAAAAHELRTPLAGLQLYGDMLADGLGDPQKTRDYAKRMSEEASRLGRVVSNVLGFSQLERGNLSVDPSVGSLDAELRSLAERAEPALDRAGAALALDVAPELTAKFDRDALARIVGNLLDNAEKYGRDAEDRTIELAAREVGDGDAVEVVISDHGPGVTENIRPTLFRPFTRGVAADGPAGLGLGLALSQSLARAMGGELAYRPGSDGGAAFVLRLPRA